MTRAGRLKRKDWERLCGRGPGEKWKGTGQNGPAPGKRAAEPYVGLEVVRLFLIEHRHDDSLAVIAEFPAEKIYAAYKFGSFTHGDGKGNIGLGGQIQRLQGDVGIFSFPSR